MNEKELYNLENFDLFISEFEDKWLQFANEEMKIKAFFGNTANCLNLFEKWNLGHELFQNEKNIAFSEPYRFETK